MKRISVYFIVGILFFSIFNGINQSSALENDFNKVAQSHNFVIITTDELVNSINSLVLWKTFRGYSVEIITLSNIIDTYQGVDTAEKIRNFLIENYEEWGIEYVLFVGSRDLIPMREVYTIPDEFEEGYGSLFTDYYYADLTGGWDADHDGLYGEYDHDSIDFTPEIHIGRIPCDDPLDVQNVCRRSIQFESDKSDLKKNALLLGSIIYYENMEAFNHVYERSDGATLMELCRTDIFEPNNFSCTTMYEKEGIRPSLYQCDYPLEYATVLSEWTKGYGIVNMLGHASEKIITRFIWSKDDGDNIPEMSNNELYYRDFLRKSDSTRLTLDKPPIVFSSGCSQLYSSNNMGKSFIKAGAATAFIGATDLALYNITKKWNDERDGGAFSLDYYFFQFLLSDHQKCGEALSNAKEYYHDHFWFTNESNYEWIWRCYSTFLSFTLYGDPSLDLVTSRKGNTYSFSQMIPFYFMNHEVEAKWANKLVFNLKIINYLISLSTSNINLY